MKQRLLLTLLILCSLLSSSCAKRAMKTEEGISGIAAIETYSPAADNGPQRFIAVGHRFVVEAPESKLAQAWDSVLKFCSTIRCEVLSSSIVSQTPTSPPRGELSLRVVPQDLQKLSVQLNRSATVLEHTTNSEDKTAVVVDTEAKLKNRTELRDRLRSLLAKTPGNVKDLVELERELTNVQSDLDSLTTTRKILANETEKVAVQITFRSKLSVTRTGVFAPITEALRDSGSVLAASLAYLITFVLAVIPWLILIIPTVWVIMRLLRRRSRKVRTVS